MTPDQERREATAFFRGVLWGLALSAPTWLTVVFLVVILIP